MEQKLKNKWWMLLGLMSLGSGFAGCEDRTGDGVVPSMNGEEVRVSLVFGFAEDSNDDDPRRLASTARLDGSPLQAAKLLLM